MFKAFAQEQVLSSPVKKEGLVVDCDYLSCDLGSFFELMSNIIQFIIWFAVVGCAIVLIYAGARLALNPILGGPVAEIANFKSKIKISLIGLLLALSAYLIVEFLFNIVGYRYDPFDPSLSTETNTKTDTPSSK